MARTRSWMSRVGRALLFAALGLVAISMAAVLLLRWIDPPYSAFMAETQIAAWLNRDRSYVFRHDWVALARISPNLALAVVASEDQKFPEHWGFDVDATWLLFFEDLGAVENAAASHGGLRLLAQETYGPLLASLR